MRKALIVGIDHYRHINPLYGCVNDAHSLKAVLERDSDGGINFDVKLLTATGPADLVTRADLRDAVESLFGDDSDVALFYFAGHGYLDATGGYLCTSDTDKGDDGLSLANILSFANKSPAKNKLVILDSCHAGIAGARDNGEKISELTDGLTILTASTAEQYATEEDGAGVFTSLLVDALSGAAANLVGEITPGSVYAHIDQSLGAWDQRPIFKTNVKRFVSLRKVKPPIELADLRRITEFFPQPGFEFQLDPDYEPDSPTPDPAKTAVFGILQQFNRVNLVVPVGAPHMYHAAMESRGCRLTALGEHYRRLVLKKRL